MNFVKQFAVKPGSDVCLSRHDPALTAGYKDKGEAAKDLEKSMERLSTLQGRLWADKKQALLIVLQAMDGGGKDGTIDHVMSGVNPQGCTVTSFKVPSEEEASHDYLWRIHRALPARGQIGIFNRSHYEDVLVVRVHKLVPKDVWSKRYDQINDFERMLSENGVRILKFFLHISKDEQRERLAIRLQDATKNWKANPADYTDRKHWGEYMEAYADALSRCSTSWAPWYIIPANRKWFRNLVVCRTIVETLEDMDPQFPKPAFDLSRIKLR